MISATRVGTTAQITVFSLKSYSEVHLASHIQISPSE